MALKLAWCLTLGPIGLPSFAEYTLSSHLARPLISRQLARLERRQGPVCGVGQQLRDLSVLSRPSLDDRGHSIRHRFHVDGASGWSSATTKGRWQGVTEEKYAAAMGMVHRHSVRAFRLSGRETGRTLNAMREHVHHSRLQLGSLSTLKSQGQKLAAVHEVQQRNERAPGRLEGICNQ